MIILRISFFWFEPQSNLKLGVFRSFCQSPKNATNFWQITCQNTGSRFITVKSLLLSKSLTGTVVWFWFFITYCSSKLSRQHFASCCILGKREVNTIAMTVCYPGPKKRGGEKWQTTLALRWKTDTHFVARFKHKHKNRVAYQINFYLSLS